MSALRKPKAETSPMMSDVDVIRQQLRVAVRKEVAAAIAGVLFARHTEITAAFGDPVKMMSLNDRANILMKQYLFEFYGVEGFGD